MTFRLSRLALLLAASTVVSAISGVVATYWVAQDEFRDVLDQDLENQGELLAQILSAENVRIPDAGLDKLLAKYLKSRDEDALWLTVYDLASGKSASNIQHDRPLHDDDDRDLHFEFDDHDWYGFQRKEGHMVVQILRRDERFDDVEDEIFEDITTPMLVVSGINLLLLGLLIGLVLWPLSRLIRELERRGPLSLAPLDLKSPAHEIVTLGNTLNRLMRGIDDTLRRERQFVNDLAHELRTPLTTLKLELADAVPDLPVLKSEVDRLALLFEQLLTMARVEQGHWQGTFVSLRLDELCANELLAMRPALEAAEIRVLESLAPRTVKGDQVLLGVLLRNLVGNVLRHCPARTALEVQVEERGGQTILRLVDNGPGMAPAQLQRVNTGFTRLDSRSQGLGLGLAICQRIAGVHGAILTFQNRPDGIRGLHIEVCFPA